MQSINIEGISYAHEVIIKNPKLILPHYFVPNIGCINYTKAKEMGIKGVIFDKDNTLTDPYSSEAHPSVICAIDAAKKVYGPGAMIISNSIGSDTKYIPEMMDVQNSLGMKVIDHRKKKPGCLDEVMAQFDAAGITDDPTELMMVGDRNMTDVAFGNRYGMLTVLVRPFTDKGDNFVVRYFARPLDKMLMKKALMNGLTAKHHPAYDDSMCNNDYLKLVNLRSDSVSPKDPVAWAKAVDWVMDKFRMQNPLD